MSFMEKKLKLELIDIIMLAFIVGLSAMFFGIDAVYAKKILPVTPDDPVVGSTKKVTIKFYDGNSLVSTKSCSYNTSSAKSCVISLPSAPKKEGYQFNGWSTSSTCTAGGYTSSFTVNASQNYYACWGKFSCWLCSNENGPMYAIEFYGEPTQTCINGLWSKTSASACNGATTDIPKDPQPTKSCYYCSGINGQELGYRWYINNSPDYDLPQCIGGSWLVVESSKCSDFPVSPTKACYVCNNKKNVMKWSTNGASDANCSSGYTKDSSITSESECNTIPESFCEVDGPSTSNLECNNSKTLESTCNKRTIVIDDVGYADVRIEQKGYISSVLTPDKTYAGGGFSFGVMYTNTVKWNYVGEVATGTLHSAITSEMNNKLIDYSSYVSALNLKEIKFGNKSIDPSFLVKKCTSSDENIDYYNRELTVSCIFYIPDSILKYNGDISYTNGVGSTVSNKYYTPTNYNGEYKIEAKLDGMSRITDNAAKKDGVDGKSWIGDWSDTFKKCDIELYPLLYKDGKPSGNESNKYNFIYRPIDIYNPFPNRNAGINWFEWYSIEKNKDRLESTYSNAEEYTAILNNEIISEIKAYNKSHNYLNWDNIDSNSGRSSFIDGKYVIRGSED